ncbi:hypothetical protein [Streptomyces sp. NBC_01579]|uniref:hypothetical protein n=1 Tax=Streptomyces sp. NBC_01579 TaxID=2975885 RepID=UPI00386D69F7
MSACASRGPNEAGRGCRQAAPHAAQVRRDEVERGDDQYLGAGVDTTVAAIGNIVALVGSHPDQFDLIRKGPSPVPAAFNEGLRVRAPVHAWGRRATEDIDGPSSPQVRRSRSFSAPAVETRALREPEWLPR